MFKRLLIIILLVAVGYHYRVEIKDWVGGLTSKIPEISFTDVGNLITTFQETVLAPQPLEVFKLVARSHLTVDGVVAETNAERQANGLATLRVNTQLQAAAAAKVQDMFLNQYFEHESPSGKGPAELVKEAGYQYILVGENLATGNFEDDDDVVTAWMNSPGHRENILHTRFTEIGVAVGRGVYKGRQVWMAVQEFGLPVTACPSPSNTLQTEVSQYRAALADLEQLLTEKRRELEAHEGSRSEYNRKAAEYNQLVDQYNALLTKTKQKIAEYNKQVEQFNVCAQGV